MDNNKSPLNLGGQLALLGILSAEQIDAALRIQEQTGEKLGEILVREGFCSEEDVAHALSLKSGLEYFSLSGSGIDMGVAEYITPAAALKYHALPVSIRGNMLYVGMRDPDDIAAIDDLKLLTGMEIRPVIALDSELSAAIDNYSNLGANITSYIVEEPEEEPTDLPDPGGDRPAVQLFNLLLDAAMRAGASDIHIEPQEKYLRIRLRIDGVLHENRPQPKSIHPSLVSHIKVMGGMDIAERRAAQDGRTSLHLGERTVDIRIATLPSVYGEKVTMRLLERSGRVISLGELGFSEDVRERYLEAARRPYGFILVTGPTGSGKSTTLYASLMDINTAEKNTITLEDPVERRLEGLNQIQINERAGITFATGLRSILRNDPDIIMIGEIRDRETAEIAVQSALTGHLVLSTLHTKDAAGAITRLGEMGVAPYLTASSLVAVLAQRLVRVLCPRCKQAYTASGAELAARFPDFPADTAGEDITLYKAKGCISCNESGYKGRIGIFELLHVSEEIQRLILQGAPTGEIERQAANEGMKTLRRDGFSKVLEGITSVEEILRVIV